MPGDDGVRRAPDAFGLAPKKSGRANHFLQRGGGGFRVIGCSAVLREQGRRYGVHSFIGALGGQYGRDQQLERIPKIELAVRVRINLRQRLYQRRDPFPRCHSRLERELARKLMSSYVAAL